FLFLLSPSHPISTLFPYTTLFRSFGTHGAIYKYNSAIIGIGNNQNIFPVVSQLFQNYPNPFNPSTSIKIYLAKTSQTKLTVYDLDRKSTRLNSSHSQISYAVFCLK